MNILFATTHSHIPFFRGGSEMSTHDLAGLLGVEGHRCGVVCALPDQRALSASVVRLRAKLSGGLGHDRLPGYDAYRSWSPVDALQRAARRFGASVVIVQAGDQKRLAEASLEAGLPTVVYLRDLSFTFSRSDGPLLERCAFIANSDFTASGFEAEVGIRPTVAPPLIRRENYANPQPGSSVLFVNPHPDKGLDVALSLAERCPQFHFIFVESWGLPRGMEAEVKARSGKLDNITWLPNQGDMRPIYAQAKVLIAPSGTPYQGRDIPRVEGWGRVATEAHFSAIPVIATNEGGLIESVGPGGVLIDRNAGCDAWEEALNLLMTDQNYHSELSSAARAYAERREIHPDHLTDVVVCICEGAVRHTPK